MKNKCIKCEAVDSYDIPKGMFGVKMKCKECGNKMLPDDFHAHRYKVDASNPRCSNTDCDFHKDPPPAKYGFIISVIEEGVMGKIFKSEAYGIVSCKNCGQVIGVGGKG